MTNTDAPTHTARIAPAQPPFGPEVQAWLDRTMPPGQPPLRLFTTLARDERLCRKFFAGGLLERGHLTLRQRELVIDRTTALCGSEYKWGVHISAFGAKVKLMPEQVHALVHAAPDAPCWPPEEQLLLRWCDALHQHCKIDDVLWAALRQQFSEEAMLELLLLAGFYRTVSCLTNVLQLPLEATGARFPPA